MKVFVAGATGATGQRVVKTLCDRQMAVRALVRDLTTARSLLPATVELVQGDVLARDSVATAMADCDAVICATGARPSFDPRGPYQVDYLGTKNLVDVAQQLGIQPFVLVSSLCVSRLFHPLNLFWLVLYWKQQAEAYLQTSGLTYTIVRPGGLRNDDVAGSLVMSAADTLFEGSIPRRQVAEVCVEALTLPAAHNKVVEVICQSTATPKNWEELFTRV